METSKEKIGLSIYHVCRHGHGCQAPTWTWDVQHQTSQNHGHGMSNIKHLKIKT